MIGLSNPNRPLCEHCALPCRDVDLASLPGQHELLCSTCLARALRASFREDHVPDATDRVIAIALSRSFLMRVTRYVDRFELAPIMSADRDNREIELEGAA